MEAFVARLIELSGEGEEAGLAFATPLFGELFVNYTQRSEPLTHSIQPDRQRAGTGAQVAASGGDGTDMRAKQGGDAGFGAPAGGGKQAVAAFIEVIEDLEEAADEAGGSPVGHADAATGFADAGQFGGGGFRCGGEHRAKGTEDDVEGGIVVGQALGAAVVEAHFEAFGVGAFLRACKESMHEVDAGDVATAAGGGEGRIACACRDVEHMFGGAEVDGLAEQFADDERGGADEGEVAGGPDLLVIHRYFWRERE